jgi:hypothetical protein
MSLIVEIKTAEGQTIALLTVEQKNFKTGSRGYHGQAKVDFDGKRYQTQLQMVEIGSKNTPASEEPRADTASEEGDE